VARAAVRIARFHVEARDPRLLWNDLRRLPSSAAAVIGGLTARK
jgi:hypothetical protein